MPPQHAAQTPAQQAAYKSQQAQSQPLGTNTQYRAPFPQLSPQMSPRSHQISPHPQMSPRPNVMSPAKQLQSQNVSNPLSPHPHMPGGPSPQPRQQQVAVQQQQQQQPSKNTTGQSGSVSTLQALEQMVMPPTGVSSNASMSTGMEYPPTSYRPSPHQQHTTNPLSPMGPRISTSPQHPQQWPPINRPASGMGPINPQQHIYSQHMQPPPPQQSQQQPQQQQIPPPQQHQTQMSMMHQQQDQNQMHAPQQHQQHQTHVPPASQMNELTAIHSQNMQPITSRNLTPFSIAELEGKTQQQQTHQQQIHSQDHNNHLMQSNLTPNLSSMNTSVNMNPPEIQAQSQLAATSSNANTDPSLLDPFAGVMEPIPPMVTPVSVPNPVSINSQMPPHHDNTHGLHQQQQQLVVNKPSVSEPTSQYISNVNKVDLQSVCPQQQQQQQNQNQQQIMHQHDLQSNQEQHDHDKIHQQHTDQHRSEQLLQESMSPVSQQQQSSLDTHNDILSNENNSVMDNESIITPNSTKVLSSNEESTNSVLNSINENSNSNMSSHRYSTSQNLQLESEHTESSQHETEVISFLC